MKHNFKKTLELAEINGLESVELASHWQELHSHGGAYRVGIVIADEKDEEVIGDHPGVWAVARHRAGVHHRTYDVCFDINEAKKRLAAYPEDWVVYDSFEEYYPLAEKMQEAAEEGTFEALEWLYEAAKKAKEYAEDRLTFSTGDIVTDRNGNEVDEPTPYSFEEDVYRYSLVFIPEFNEDE